MIYELDFQKRKIYKSTLVGLFAHYRKLNPSLIDCNIRKLCSDHLKLPILPLFTSQPQWQAPIYQVNSATQRRINLKNPASPKSCNIGQIQIRRLFSVTIKNIPDGIAPNWPSYPKEVMQGHDWEVNTS